MRCVCWTHRRPCVTSGGSGTAIPRPVCPASGGAGAGCPRGDVGAGRAVKREAAAHRLGVWPSRNPAGSVSCGTAAGRPALPGSSCRRRGMRPSRGPGLRSWATRVLAAPGSGSDFGFLRDGGPGVQVSGLGRRGRLSRESELGRVGGRLYREAGGCCLPALGLAVPETRGSVPCEAAAGRPALPVSLSRGVGSDPPKPLGSVVGRRLC